MIEGGLGRLAGLMRVRPHLDPPCRFGEAWGIDHAAEAPRTAPAFTR